MSERIPKTVTREHNDYGRLWTDGTFTSLGWTDENYSRREFEKRSYELKDVPESLRPVFGVRTVVTTIETYPAEACPEATT